MEESIHLHFDGSCEPINPGGRMGFGVHVSTQNGEVLFKNSTGEEASPRNSNNVAEYRALTIGLEWLIGNGYQNRRVVVKGDSALVINQLNGAWRARGGLYYAEYLKAVELRDQFADITFEWVRREFNQVADDLSRTETFTS